MSGEPNGSPSQPKERKSMIRRLVEKDVMDMYDLVLNSKELLSEFYFTENKERIQINNLKTVRKVIKNHLVFGLYENGLQAIVVILFEKGFRTYIKFLVKDNIVLDKMMKYLMWNFSTIDLFIKLKKDNSFVKLLRRFHFDVVGLRGTEILLVHKQFPMKPLSCKDDLLGE